MDRRLLLLLAVGVAAVAVPVASADTTYRVAGGASAVTSPVTDCAFPVQVSSNYSYVVNLRFDSSGLIHEEQQIVEQDTFTGPSGKTLTGNPYRYNSQSTVDATTFKILSENTSGQVESVPLPDGSVFYSAGRVNLTADPYTFSITPDAGHSGNVAGFCAALAP
jgi:hypothetical protein